MNREIKFRAWDKRTQEICEVLEIDFAKERLFINARFTSTIYMDGSLHYGKTLRALKKVELMQFTGLIDKNGTEIYEGDVVRDRFGEVIIVQWYEGQFVVTRQVLNGSGQRFEYNNINNHINHYSKFEVIGNIYENPELRRKRND